MDDETLQKLVRLKRHEQPEDGYYDGFLREFHQRQRQELLKRSSLSLFFERLNTYLSDPRSQGWAYAPVLAIFLLAFYAIVSFTEDTPVPSIAMSSPVHEMGLSQWQSGQIVQASWHGPTLMANPTEPERPLLFTSEVCVPRAPVQEDSATFANIIMDLEAIPDAGGMLLNL